MYNQYNLNELEEILKALGYSKKDCENKAQEEEENSSSGECHCKIDPTGGATSNCCSNLNLDIPGGFQDVNPMIFIVIGEIIGNVISGNVPFNVANSIANFLNLIGQIVETYAAQQAYFQAGPGRYYDLAYKNIANPFCSSVCDDNDNDNDELRKIQMQEISNEFTRLNIKLDNLYEELDKIKGK